MNWGDRGSRGHFLPFFAALPALPVSLHLSATCVCLRTYHDGDGSREKMVRIKLEREREREGNGHLAAYGNPD